MIDNSILNVGYFIVAYIDILGQKSKLKKINALPDSNDKEEINKLLDKIRDTFGIVKIFYDNFDIYFKSFIDAPFRVNLPDEIKQKLRQSKIEYQLFSDCVVIHFSTREINDYIPLLDLYGLIGACASNYLLLLGEGISLRAQ